MRVDRDRPLVEALRLREPTAVERLVRAYGHDAYRLAVGLTELARRRGHAMAYVRRLQAHRAPF